MGSGIVKSNLIPVMKREEELGKTRSVTVTSWRLWPVRVKNYTAETPSTSHIQVQIRICKYISMFYNGFL